jgi:hypothetical protein
MTRSHWHSGQPSATMVQSRDLALPIVELLKHQGYSAMVHLALELVQFSQLTKQLERY